MCLGLDIKTTEHELATYRAKRAYCEEVGKLGIENDELFRLRLAAWDLEIEKAQEHLRELKAKKGAEAVERLSVSINELLDPRVHRWLKDEEWKPMWPRGGTTPGPDPEMCVDPLIRFVTDSGEDPAGVTLVEVKRMMEKKRAAIDAAKAQAENYEAELNARVEIAKARIAVHHDAFANTLQGLGAKVGLGPAPLKEVKAMYERMVHILNRVNGMLVGEYMSLERGQLLDEYHALSDFVKLAGGREGRGDEYRWTN